MNNFKVLAYLCSAAVLAACSQPEPAMEMSAEPIYNKMGEVVGCTDGRTFVPGTAPMEDPCAPPVNRNGDDRDQSDDNGGRDLTGAQTRG